MNGSLIPDALQLVVESALLKVANNVAKHLIQRDGWTKNDTCFRIDLRQAEQEILATCRGRTMSNRVEQFEVFEGTIDPSRFVFLVAKGNCRIRQCVDGETYLGISANRPADVMTGRTGYEISERVDIWLPPSLQVLLEVGTNVKEGQCLRPGPEGKGVVTVRSFVVAMEDASAGELCWVRLYDLPDWILKVDRIPI